MGVGSGDGVSVDGRFVAVAGSGVFVVLCVSCVDRGVFVVVDVGVWVGDSVTVAGGGSVEGTVAAGVQAARNNSGAVRATQNKTRQDMLHSPLGLLLPIKNTTGEAS